MNTNTWLVILDPLSFFHSTDQDALNNQDIKTSGPVSRTAAAATTTTTTTTTKSRAKTAAKTAAKNITGKICPVSFGDALSSVSRLKQSCCLCSVSLILNRACTCARCQYLENQNGFCLSPALLHRRQHQIVQVKYARGQSLHSTCHYINSPTPLQIPSQPTMH